MRRKDISFVAMILMVFIYGSVLDDVDILLESIITNVTVRAFLYVIVMITSILVVTSLIDPFKKKKP